MTGGFTHFNAQGEAHMVDVGAKAETVREAQAEGVISMLPATLQMVLAGNHKKGDVLAIARIAGIMAAKKTPELIPLAHPISLTAVELELQPEPEVNQIVCRATVRCCGKTGVEIEALNAVQVALLTVYDMCKAVDRGMEIAAVRLLTKTGGKSGDWRREVD